MVPSTNKDAFSTEASDSTSANLTEVRAVFTRETYDLILKIAAMTSTTPGSVIRDALSLYDWALQERLKGNHIATERDGKVLGRAYFSASGEVPEDKPESSARRNWLNKLFGNEPPADRRVTL
jgi:hypothetical protein